MLERVTHNRFVPSQLAVAAPVVPEYPAVNGEVVWYAGLVNLDKGHKPWGHRKCCWCCSWFGVDVVVHVVLSISASIHDDCMQTNNNMTNRITNDTVKQKQFKAMDMHFYVLCNHKQQKSISGAINQAGLFLKHHHTSHHQAVHPTYLNPPAPAATNYYACLSDPLWSALVKVCW